MTCKDCFHYDVCVFHYKGNENKQCLNFKNKADVVPVVRCKDCKHRYAPTRCSLWYGTVNDQEYFIERGEDFYCSYGERK